MPTCRNSGTFLYLVSHHNPTCLAHLVTVSDLIGPWHDLHLSRRLIHIKTVFSARLRSPIALCVPHAPA